MSETIDPITWLKDYLANGKHIEHNKEASMLEFENSSIKLPMSTQTAWKRKDGKGHYTLGALWLLLKNRSLRTGDYLKQAHQFKIPIVEYSDKDDAIKYFTGQI
jgi:hypothetical protein